MSNRQNLSLGWADKADLALEGTLIELQPSAARGATAGANGTAVPIVANRMIILLDVTAAQTENTDTLSVYIDFSLDNVTFYNGGRFTTVLGNGGAKKFFMVFDPSNPGTAGIDVTADAAANAVRPALFGAYVRERHVIVDGGGAVASFTYSVKGFAL